MTSNAYLVGAFSTSFGKRTTQSYKDLTREAYLGALMDAGLHDVCHSRKDGPSRLDIGSAWFANTTLYRQKCGIGGQVLFTPLVREGLFPEHVPFINVQNACASGSSAMRGAYLDIVAGQSNLALAIGVEKLLDPGRSAAETAEMFQHGIDQFDPGEWLQYYTLAGEQAGKQFMVPDNRSMFMDTYAMQAAWHMKKYGTTQYQYALAAAKTHNFGSLNPRAQYRYTTTAEEVLNEREISFPLTKPMCAPMGDGAAAVLVCSQSYLETLPDNIQERAIRILACEMSGGIYRSLDEPGLSYYAAKKAFKRSGLAPSDIDLAEVHDATSFSEIYQAEMMGFCALGHGGPFVQEGRTGPDGDKPINTSGGLVSKGHPIGATGVSMIVELCEQLRGESGARQVRGAKHALAESGGGVIGFDEAVCVVSILASAR